MRGRTSRLKVIVSMLMLMALFVFGAVFMTACSDECAHKNMEHHEAVSATCTKTGNSEYWTCPDCNKIYADEAGTEELSAIPEIAKTDHVWEEAYQNDENGHWHKCQNCDVTSASEPHTVVAIGEEKPATCTGDGITAGGKCCICNYVIEEQKTLNNLGHKLTHFIAKEATCSTAGNIEYWYCERCDSCFTDEAATQEVEKAKIESPIDPSAHKFGETQAEVPATCTTAGVKAHKDCEYCKKHFAEDGTEITDLTITALGHSYTVDARPKKLTYFVGENFDATGMKVTATCTRDNCDEVVSVTEYTLSGNTNLTKGAQTVTVTWNDGTQDLAATVNVSVYEKHDLTQAGSYADFVYAASGDLTAAAAGQLSGTAADVVCGGNTYTDGMRIASGTSLTLTKEAAQGILGDKTYGDFTIALYSTSYDWYELNIAVVTKKIATAQDLTEITTANQNSALVDGYYIVTADFDAAEAGIQMSGSVQGNNWSATAVSFVDVDAALSGSGFSGIFDGRGHTISNLNTFSYKFQGMGGLFGQLLEGSVVRNVAFTDVTIAGRFGCVLVGYDSQFKGAMENVVITVKENLANEGDVAAKRAKILWELSGGSIYNCLFVNVEEVSVRGEVESMDKLRVMSVTPNAVDAVKENGGINASGTKYSGQSNYESINAMFAELKEENVLSGWNCGITYADGAISFNGEKIVKPVIVVSYECENNEITRGTSVTFTTDGYARIDLRQSVDGVSIQENILTVAGTVAENTTITVLVTSTLNASVTQEITFKVIRAYTAETIAEALDFSLEGENSAAAVTIDGMVERIVAGSVAVTEGITYQSETLTLTKAALTTLLNGKQYAEGLTVNIFTSADKRYAATLNIATMLIDSVDDLTTIMQTNTAATIDAYYIVTENIDASTAGVTVNCTGNGQTYQNVVRFVNNDKQQDNTVGFKGIFDGRGHVISNITSYAYAYNGLGGLFGQLLEGSVVKNIAFTEVTAVGRYGTILVGESMEFCGTISNVVIAVAETNLTGTGAHTCAYIVSRLNGGTFENCLFTGVGANAVDTKDGGTDGTASNVMTVASLPNAQSNGGFHGSVGNAFKSLPVYASVEAMFEALATDDKLQDWGDITYSDGAIFFNGAKVLEKVIA